MRDCFLPWFCLTLYVIVATVGAFTGGIWAALAIGGGLVMGAVVWARDKKLPQPSRPVMLFALATLVLFAVEIPLSSNGTISTHVWLQLATIFGPLTLLTVPRLQQAARPALFAPVIALAIFIGAVMLGLELSSGGALLHMTKKSDASLTEYNRGIAHLSILAFPVFAALWQARQRVVVLLLAAGLLFPASLTESHTAKLALLAGGLCAGAAFYRPLWVRNGLAAGSALLLGFPFYAQKLFSTRYDAVESLHHSWRHRMEIWDYLSYRIMERPWLGWGLGTTHTLDFTQPHGNLYRAALAPAPHAHNFITELWVETGLIGLALGLAFLLFTLHRAAALSPKLRPFALGAWVAAVAVSLFGFDFWTDSLWGAFALSAFAFGMLQQQIERVPDRIDR